MTDGPSPGRLAPGDAAPDFALTDSTGASVSLSDLLASGRSLILYVYPAAMTPGCTTQACDFRDSLGSLQAAGYAVVGVSPDAPAKLASFVEHQLDPLGVRRPDLHQAHVVERTSADLSAV